MKKLFYRAYQKFMKVALYFLNFREPQILSGQNSMEELSNILNQKKISKCLIVTDKGIINNHLLDDLIVKLKLKEIEFSIFDQTVPNPTIQNIEDGLKIYKDQNCQCLICVGGGSSMDCGKGIGARIANPKKSISKMRGQLKVNHKLPLLIAIPTTSGTGSETTLAAVITDQNTHEKYAINDTKLIPQIAVLDPNLTKSLPPFLTATTGMDALTHAVEAYIGRSNTKATRKNATKAVSLIFDNLEKAYTNGNDIQARQNMLTASYLAGLAFTRAFVGNVHAIAHTLGGEYGVAHGLANAVILPKVLNSYGKTIYKKIGKLCADINIFSNLKTNKEKTIAFINKIDEMNKSFDIPNYIEQLRKQDIPKLIKRASKEANPLYPVPKIFDYKDFENIYTSLLKNDN